MAKKYCISFAGPIGSSKTPIAYYLSQKFNLIMINNDTIRIEVTEERGYLDEEEYQKRRNNRVEEMLETGQSFIFDASIDRSWDVFEQYLKSFGYSWFVISIDISKELLTRLYHAKNYSFTPEEIDQNYEEHQQFLKEHPEHINLHLTDDDFLNRLELSAKAFEDWTITN